MIKRWEEIPEDMRNEDVKRYYDILITKKVSLLLKRIFDIIVAIIFIIVLFPVFIIIGAAIKIDSKGPIMFSQVRVTQYCKQFRIIKFRTMVDNADNFGPQITCKNDIRITNVGRVLRKFRLDEIPQLFNIVAGDMTFVGTRPEVIKYVEKYSPEMKATLLLPAGVTSEASIRYKDEGELLKKVQNADEVYIEKILPEKMKYNLNSIEGFSFLGEIKTIIRTIGAVLINKDENLDIGEGNI